jgi:hypothetical protein
VLVLALVLALEFYFMAEVSFFTTCLLVHLYFRTMLHIPFPSSTSLDHRLACLACLDSGWLAGWLAVNLLPIQRQPPFWL